MQSLSDQPHDTMKNAEQVTVTIPLSLLRKMKKAARRTHESQPWFIRGALMRAVKHIELTAEDYMGIAEAMRA